MCSRRTVTRKMTAQLRPSCRALGSGLAAAAALRALDPPKEAGSHPSAVFGLAQRLLHELVVHAGILLLVKPQEQAPQPTPQRLSMCTSRLSVCTRACCIQKTWHAYVLDASTHAARAGPGIR